MKEYIDNLFKNVLIHHKKDAKKLESMDGRKFFVHEGDEISALYFVIEGTVKIYQDFTNGKRILLGYYDAPLLLGDVEYVLTNKIATCTVETVKDLVYYRFPYDELDKWYGDNLGFTKYLLHGVSKKLLFSNRNVSLNLMYSLETRLASYMLSESKLVGSSFIRLITITDLANQLGTSYRHIQRVLSKFQDENVISRDGHHVVILDKDTLLDIGEGNIYDKER